MAPRSKHTFIATASLFSLVLGGLGAANCGAYKNPEERAAAAAENGATLPDYKNCQNGVCVPDPGSREVTADECAEAEKSYEFMPIPIMDMEDVRTVQQYTQVKDQSGKIVGVTEETVNENFALLSYTYDDDTTQSLVPSGWEPVAVVDRWNRCGKTDNHVMHLDGGPFLEWGGGFGRSLRCINGNYQSLENAVVDQNTFWADRFVPELRSDGKTLYDRIPVALDDVYCHVGSNVSPQAPAAIGACGFEQTDPLALSVCPERDKKILADPTDVTKEDLPLIGVTVDVTKWDGISFWARRGPNSQAGLRVAIGDKQTDDDISFAQFFIDPQAEPFCHRTFECACKDQSVPCTIVTQEDVNTYNQNHLWYWGKPIDANDKSPMTAGDGICWDPDKTELGVDRPDYPYCGQSACIHQFDSAKSLNGTYDPVTYGTECLEFSFRGSITSSFCYDPKSDIPSQRQPYEGSETCGDHWMRSIALSYDWEFYTVPFTSLQQQGWAKRSYWLDLTAVTLARITWDRGFVDFYIDDVRFYRKK